ncbi:MAG: efflux RND transporter periplasmic adaptor subunit [Candidatus Didemnitutus sp.]|nr:efflux RND transporter periplasmic adaptor subunit [Candidatus Didemnitutus sp.]
MRAPPVFVIAIAGLLLGAGFVVLLPEQSLFQVADRNDDAAAAARGERYACPMMDFIGNRPGACPVCGMQMTRVTAGELTREQQRRMGVELTTAVMGAATMTVRGYGIADYDTRYASVVIPRVPGRVVKRYMATWGCCESIAAGAPIVDLYSPEAYSAQGELAAAVKLGDQPTINALQERFVRWNLADVAEAIIAGGAPRDVVTIRSPFAGTVVLRDFELVSETVQVGREVTADTPLLRLVDPDRLTLVVQVPEGQARFLREGQPVRIASDELGPLPDIEAKIERLSFEISPDTRTREVRVYIRGAAAVLNPGALVSAHMQGVLDENLRPADPEDPDTWGRFVLVPKTAVISTGVRNVAWRVAGRERDGRLRFELAPLALGPRLEDDAGNDLYVVRAGLQPGDEVATQGVFLIDSQAQLAGTPSLLFPHGATAPAAGGHSH